MPNENDAIELLLHDHQRITDLAERLDATDDPVETRTLYLQIVEQLAGHEAAEQQVVFPAYRASREGVEDTLRHRVGEHEELNELLTEMRGLAPNGLAFTKRGSALLLEITEHFRREEETVFTAMRESFSAAQLAELADKLLVAKQHAPAFPEEHPRIGTR